MLVYYRSVLCSCTKENKQAYQMVACKAANERLDLKLNTR